MSAQIITFGCRLNSYEGEVIRSNAESAGLKDAIIFNTCAVTAEAERQARQAIRKARRMNPKATIIVTGCAAQIKPEHYAGMQEVDHVIGNEEKMQAATYNHFTATSEKIRVNDIMSVKETASHMVTSFEGKVRAFIQVQNGCNHRCTFCIIPFGRGNSRSVPIGEIVQQIRALLAQGYKEVVLTGVDISGYGSDLPGAPTLGQMMRRVLALVPELPRLRLSSIDAIEVDDDLLRLIAEEPRLMPHLHLSLQAGDDMILKRMKRRHSRADALTFMAKVRNLRPDVVFGADFITGFPTETDAMFDNTLRLVEEAGLTYLHVFPYSARESTPAARMPQVPSIIRKQRAATLRAAGEQQMQRFLQHWVGKEVSVLVEHNTARTEHFAPIILDKALREGSIAKVRVTGVHHHNLIGRCAA